MKRLTYLTIPIRILLLLFLCTSIIGFPCHAQAEDSIPSPSHGEPAAEMAADTEPETETETEPETEFETEIQTEMQTEMETERETEMETEIQGEDVSYEDSQPETEPPADTPREFQEMIQPDSAIASSSHALAAVMDSAAPIEITNIEVGRFQVNRIHLLMRGTSSASLDLPPLEGTINFYREGEGFPEKNVPHSVIFETEDFDRTYGNQTGLFFLKASIILEDPGYVMAPGVSAEVSIPVFLYDPDQPSFLPPLHPYLNNYDAMEAFHVVTDVHGDLPQVEEILHKDYPYQSFYVYFENGYYLNLPNAWDLSAVEIGTPGIYPAYRRPKLPEGVLMEQLPEAVCSINIQDSQVFTLSSPISFGNNIVITWLYPTPEQSLFQLRYRIGQGDWTPDTDGYFMCLQNDRNGKLSLFLNPWEMEKDIHYQFQLEYDGVCSDILNLCVNQDGFYIPNEGDEDGGDRGTQTPPDVIQPQDPSSPEEEASTEEETSQEEAASTEEETSPSPAETQEDKDFAAISTPVQKKEMPPSQKTPAAAEEDTSTAATWSGKRIRQYLNASPGLPLIFEKDLIRVAIPADSSVLLNLSDSDVLHVEILALSADTLRLTASINGIPLTGIPMTVTMPWAGDGKSEGLQVTEKAREWIGKVDELTPEGSITFTVTQSGVYTILSSVSEESAETATGKERLTVTHPAMKSETSFRQAGANVLSVMGLSVILILCSISVIVFLHYKRKED